MKKILSFAFSCMTILMACDYIEQSNQNGQNIDEEKQPAADTLVYVPVIQNKGEAIDLSVKERANCYIVTEPGVYSFKAVKGNGKEVLEGIASASVLWETWCTTETVIANSVVAEVDFDKEKMYFRIDKSFHSGNAVIAAKNASGDVLWSWHIWVPETPITDDLFTLSRRKSLSRNLGALVDASLDGASSKSAGLLYQWGRKDPFVGSGDFTTGEAASVTGVVMSKSGGQMTVEDAIKNPTVFADNNGNWTDSSDNLWARDKTIYDPCPAGYRLPNGSEYILFSNPPSEIQGYMYDAEKDVFAVGKPVTTFPFCGYMSWDGTFKNVGTGAYAWSSRVATAASSAYEFSLVINGEKTSYSNSTATKANAYAVRCLSNELTAFENAPGTPVKGAYTKFTVNMQELSGLCLHTDGSFLWGVGDQGVLARIEFDGTMTKVLGKSHDMESVTIAPETNDLYIGCEPNYVYKIPAPDYNKTEEVFRVAEASKFGNSGIEGISWYKDGMILVGTQVGAYMWAYKLDGTPVWRKSMNTVAMGMKEIADICYDPVKDQIWIIDSETQTIYLFNGDATEHLASYRVSFGGNCESIYLDYANSCVWIADDTDTSRLYKIDFEF